MRATIFMLALLICGCSSQPSPEEKYDMVRRSGTLGDACRQARDAASFYLNQGDQSKYERWTTIAGGDCTMADLEGARMPADPVARASITKQADDLENAANARATTVRR